MAQQPARDNRQTAASAVHAVSLSTASAAGQACRLRYSVALARLAHQLGFEAIAERSENAAWHFPHLRLEMDREAHSADARQIDKFTRGQRSAARLFLQNDVVGTDRFC
jgi:hypothetical protein